MILSIVLENIVLWVWDVTFHATTRHSKNPFYFVICFLLCHLIWLRASLICVYSDIFSDTDNTLTREVGGYKHVVILRNTKVVDGDFVKALQKLPRGTTDGDCIHKFIGFMFC